MGLVKRGCLVLAICLAASGCARKVADITPHAAEPSLMAGASCSELKQARANEEVEMARWALPVTSSWRRDRFAVAFGIIGTIIGLRGDGPEHGFYASALGRRDHINGLIAKQGC